MHDIPEILQALKLSPAVLSHFVRSIPEERLDIRRGEGFWTVAEHVSHLAQVQPMLLRRMERFLAEEAPQFMPYLPGQGGDEPATPQRMAMEAALEQFRSFRERQLRLLETAPGPAWDRKGSHPEYEMYSLYLMTRHVLMHDHWHMYRMEELWLTRDVFLTKLE